MTMTDHDDTKAKTSENSDDLFSTDIAEEYCEVSIYKYGIKSGIARSLT